MKLLVIVLISGIMHSMPINRIDYNAFGIDRGKQETIYPHGQRECTKNWGFSDWFWCLETMLNS